MFENIAAIDIGTTTVKMIKARTSFSDFQIKSLSCEDIDLDNPNREEAISNAILKMLGEDPIKGFKVLANLPMEKSIIRNISFPFSDVEKIAEAIPFEAEENIPFNIDDLVMDFQSLKSENREEGKILLAAAHKETVHDFIRSLKDNTVIPFRMGLEANSLFECYNYFNTVEDETIIQLDIGNNKSIINIIKNKHLQYTRSISTSLNDIHKSIAEYLKIAENEAAVLFKNLNTDILSYENILDRDYYKNLNFKKPQLKKISSITEEVINDLNEQLMLTIRAYRIDNPEAEFSRILISGGGSNINGLSSQISRELEITVVPMPFLEDYKDQKIRSQFPIVFGLLLSYINKKNSYINFLKGEFIPDLARSSKKIYYLSGMFLGLSVLVLLINIIISFFMTSQSNRYYDSLLMNNYRKYFNDRSSPGDPLDAARKKLKKEKLELDNLTVLVPDNSSILDLMNDSLSLFSKDESFSLKNMVINESIIRIDGTINSSQNIDDFKSKLSQSGKFEKVDLDIKSSRKNEVRFSMTIKKKKTEEVKGNLK